VCTFITVTLPLAAETDVLRDLFKSHRRRLDPVVNPFLAAQLPPGLGCFLTAWKMCDCGTAVGLLAGVEPEPPDRGHPRRRGWSEARTARWEAERAAHAARVRERLAATTDADAAAWVALLRAVVAAGVSEVGLLHHWYFGGVDTERFAVTVRQPIPGDALTEQGLLRLPPDHLCRIVPAGNGAARPRAQRPNTRDVT
jgi:hypothetical protein